MNISVSKCGKHDDRLGITFSRGDTILRIVGYDELPLRIHANGRIDRIGWQEFRLLLTAPVNSKEEMEFS